MWYGTVLVGCGWFLGFGFFFSEGIGVEIFRYRLFFQVAVGNGK